MGKLRSVDVIQIDATIITGLLILLTVQFIDQPTTFTWQSEDQKELELIDEQLPQNNMTYHATLDTIQQLKATQHDVTDPVRYEYIQKQIDDMHLKLIQTQTEGSQLLDEQGALLQKGIIAPKGVSSETAIKLIAITMTVPFLVSAGLEIISTMPKKKKNPKDVLQNTEVEKPDIATSGSKISMFIGIIILLFGLYGIETLLLSCKTC